MRLSLLLVPSLLLVACAAEPTEAEPRGSSESNLTDSDMAGTCGDNGGAQYEPWAIEQPAITDCGDDAHEIKGALSNYRDKTWYKVPTTDRKLCAIEAWVSTPSQDIQVCVFARCASDQSNAIESCSESGGEASENGLKGCCVGNGHIAIPNYKCPDGRENVDLLFRVEASRKVKDARDKTCRPFTVEFEF